MRIRNTRYEVESVIPGQEPKMKEQMIAQAEASRAPQTLEIMITVSQGGGPRYPASRNRMGWSRSM
jgi:hypothetical protein